MHKNLVIEPDSVAFNIWKDPPAKIYRKYFLWDVTNPDEVQAGREKPNLVERGPYVFVEKWAKVNIQFLGTNFVSYSPTQTIYFDADLSNGDLSDPITFLNVPAIVCK